MDQTKKTKLIIVDNIEPIHSIWGKFLSGDKEAFAFLYNNHINSLYRYGTKISSSDKKNF